MGCWNQTCGLTQLHIRHGDEVMVFAMVKNRKVDSLCYSTPFYSPIMMPFYAKYDDYGGGEECSGLGLPIVMDVLKRNLVELPVGDNKYHDIAVKREDFNDQLFFEACQEHRMFVKGRFDRERQHVNFVMFRKDVIDHLIGNRVLELYVGPEKGTYGWDNSYVSYKFEDILADVPAVADYLLTVESTPLGLWEPMHQLRNLGSNYAAKWLQNGTDYRFSNMFRIDQYVVHLIQKKAKDKLVEFLSEYLKAVFIDSFLLDTRKHWSPQSGAGSQQQEHKPYRLLMSAMEHVLDAEKAEWESENEGEYEG